MARVDTRNVARYWVPGHAAGLSLLRADFTTHEYPPHTHEAFVIAVTEAGSAEIRTPGRVDLATPRTLFVSNPGEPQSARLGASRRWRYRAFYLARPAIDALARDLGIERVPYFARSLFADRDLVDEFLSLHRALELDGDAPRARELLVAAMGRLLRRHGSGGRIAPGPRDGALLRKALAHVRARYAERLPLTELGNVLGLTPFQLIGLFRQGTGLTPHAYLTQVRLGAACRLLKRGHSIAEAAADSGFYDQSALTRYFKRSYGITPLQFQRAAARLPAIRRAG